MHLSMLIRKKSKERGNEHLLQRPSQCCFSVFVHRAEDNRNRAKRENVGTLSVSVFKI